MITALEILSRMDLEWLRQTSAGASGGEETDHDQQVMRVWFNTLAFIHDHHLNDYRKLKNDAAKIGHFRQLFTSWKAACARLEKTPAMYLHYSNKLSALRAFPVFFEELLPEIYYVLCKHNVFLGVKFTDEDKHRLRMLESKFVAGALERERKRNDQIFTRMMFGA